MRIADGVFLIIFTLTTPCVCLPDPPAQQQTSSGDLAIFSRFFSQVASLLPPTEVIHLNGRPSDVRSPTLQESIGLSDREADLVSAVAMRCQEERNLIDRSAGALTLSARLDSIDGQSENKQYAALLRKRGEIIATAIDTIKGELGSPRFDVLATFVLQGSTKPNYFPLRRR